MINLWEAVLVFLLISLIVLVFQIIFFIYRARDAIARVNDTMRTLNKNLPEVMENVNKITNSAAKASSKVETTVADIVEMEQIVSKEIKDPLKNIASAIANIIQLANRVFFRKSSKKKDGDK
jgi:methyl-accepting chemotaxis protein